MSSAQASILIVDDDPTLVQLMAQMLSELGTLRFARSGEAALSQARRNKPDLILMDAEMPGMSGFDACLALKADFELADVPVLFVTSHHALEMEIRGFEMGAADFIHKPVSEPILRARVSTHLKLKRANDELRRLAGTDALTQLPNRRSLDGALATEWARAQREAQPLCALLIDVDRFKLFNDRYGHPAGDACLRGVAAALAGVMRRPADFVARYGGEEFAALLPNTDLEGACLIAGRLVDAVRQLAIPHEDGVVDGVVTVSVGVALGQGSDAFTAETLMQRADEALYRAKREGRSQYCSHSDSPQPPAAQLDGAAT
ncbi:diguanylate cyclase domain-containing protein [Roseateles asaccharophilus]|nr:diguanylate cyclase [Roseateles asaccharophilus]